MTKIRNFIQTAQEREIIKTAPDMVVYIEGLPYIENEFVRKDGKASVVNFNDYITAITTSYSVDSMIPSGSITLIVPNGHKHLFLTPGGGTILEVMSSVKIYAKGYFFSKKGNTVYKRVFNGMIKSVDYADTTTAMEISISIAGVCRFLEIAQIDLKAAIVSQSSQGTVVERSNQAKMNVYQALRDTLYRQIDFSEFLLYSMRQDIVHNMKEAVKKGYITKWAQRLNDLKRDIRIFNPQKKMDAPTTQTPPKPSADAGKPATEAPITSNTESQSQKENAALVSKLKKYHFDMSITPLTLYGGQLVSRLERIRHLVDIAGFEGYQDIDGLIIVKPPLYNLDSTIIGEPSQDPRLDEENLSDETNPYIVHLSEILSENYTEDEGSIRRTSMTLSPNWVNPSGLQVEAPLEIQQIVRYVDVNLLRKFGARDEAPKPYGFLTEDKQANYGFAICELNRANRAYRTYNVSIPLRPELKLGFPIYFPHKDMYGYLVGAAISYNVGGQATMSLTCNFIRKRPMFPLRQTIVDEQTKKQRTVEVLSSQPNLVHIWKDKAGQTSTVFQAKTLESQSMEGLPSTIIVSEKPTDDNQAKLDYQERMGVRMEVWTDTLEGEFWRIQKDDGTLKLSSKFKDTKNKTEQVNTVNLFYNAGFDPTTGRKPRAKDFAADDSYLRRISVVQPYTDEKGYEVVPALPWGRYSTLREAIVDMTKEYWADEDGEGKEELREKFSQASAFLVSGLAVPGTAEELVRVTKLFKETDKVDLLAFELAHTEDGVTEDESTFIDMAKPIIGAATNEEGEKSIMEKVEVYLNGYLDGFSDRRVSRVSGDISIDPQNTDIGGYQTPLGPLDQVLQGMKATFDASAYGKFFTNFSQPSSNTYFEGELLRQSTFRSPTIGTLNSVQSFFNKKSGK